MPRGIPKSKTKEDKVAKLVELFLVRLPTVFESMPRSSMDRGALELLAKEVLKDFQCQ